VKKASVQEGYIYFWDEPLNIGYLTPTLDSRIKLADAIWDMRGEELSRIQFKDLMEAVINGDAVTEAELAAIKKRVLNPASGVSYTPRKKPRYSEDTWDFPDMEMLPTIAEGPATEDPEVLQEHIRLHWKSMVQAIEALKSAAGQNTKYEEELDMLGNDIDSVRAALARVTSLVGNPVDGIAFDIFGIMDQNEDALTDLDRSVQDFKPKLDELEARGLSTQAEVKKFRESTGDKLLIRLGEPESSVRAMEASAAPDALSGIVVQIRSALVGEIFPAIRNLWGLFELTTTGKLGSCKARGKYDAGGSLLRRLVGWCWGIRGQPDTADHGFGTRSGCVSPRYQF
jgi:hypothetical protein